MPFGEFMLMIKKIFLKMPIICCMFLLFFVVACASNSQVSIPGTSNGMQTTTTIPVPATSTVSPAGFAATVGSSSNPVNRSAQGNNLTTIHSPVDRPVAKFSETVLNVPPQAKGNVYIQNDSDNPMTLVSDT